jgi:hypothetical protein
MTTSCGLLMPPQVPTRVFDEGDGTYIVAVFLLHPGTFTIFAWLW